MPRDPGSRPTPGSAVTPEPSTTEEVVEVPVHSPRWSYLFVTIGFGVVIVGGFFSYFAPSLLIAHADRICARENAERARERTDTTTFSYEYNLAPACERAQRFHSEYDGKLTMRGQHFLLGALPIAAMFFLIARRLRAERTPTGPIRSCSSRWRRHTSW